MSLRLVRRGRRDRMTVRGRRDLETRETRDENRYDKLESQLCNRVKRASHTPPVNSGLTLTHITKFNVNTIREKFQSSSSRPPPPARRLPPSRPPFRRPPCAPPAPSAADQPRTSFSLQIAAAVFRRPCRRRCVVQTSLQRQYRTVLRNHNLRTVATSFALNILTLNGT